MSWTAWTAGLVLIGIAVVMLLLARPKNGEAAPFLTTWIVGQLYAMTTLTSLVMGVTLVIIDWPF